MSKRKPQSTKRLKDLANEAFSLYIRTRDADRYMEDNEGNSHLAGKCISCPKVEMIKYMDAGHFIPKGSCSALRYDEFNANLQCSSCNRFHDGEQYEHGRALIRKFGSEQMERLQFEKAESKKTTKNWGKTELREIAEYYKNKLRELEPKA